MAVSTAESVRAFIAIALEPGLVAELKKVQQELQARMPDDSVRWTRPEQLHLTLKFFGQVAAQEQDVRPRVGLAEQRLVRPLRCFTTMQVR